MSRIRNTIQQQVHGLVGFGSGSVNLDTPKGDPGLFGPASMTWRVHGDFTSMMVGGIAALLLQMLHPGALAGVWDHSNFREDALGRLRRTAQFVAGTTYASQEEAERLIKRVRAVHHRVQGSLPNGEPYSANDPALLTWVHVAEVTSFLQAYMRYRDPMLSRSAQDRYFQEMATIPERLGATDVPATRQDVDTYLRRVRPRLRCDHRTRDVTNALFAQPAPSKLLGPFRGAALEAGVDLLPAWAAAMHGFQLTRLHRHMVRARIQAVRAVTTWAMQDGSAQRAKKRVGA